MGPKKAFTLPELLIGVTISAIIMVGVSIFVSSGIGDAFKIRKNIENNRESADFETALNQTVLFGGETLYQGAFDSPYGTGFVLKNSRLPFPLTVLATRSATGVCDAFSGQTAPPVGLSRLTLLRLSSPEGVKNAWGMTVDHAGHAVRNASGSVVIGTGNPGSKGGDGSAGTATELRYPTAIAKIAEGKYLVADTGNDRILFYDGTSVTTFLGQGYGIRHPNSIVTDGTDIRIGGSEGVMNVLGNPVEDGGSFTMNRRSDKDFTFDSIRIVLGGARTAPANPSSYAFDFTDPNVRLTQSGSEALIDFSGAVHSYSRNSPMSVAVTGIATPAVSTGAYQTTVTYLLSWATAYQRTERYFTKADGDPLTLGDNAFLHDGKTLQYPSNLSYVASAFSVEDISWFESLANSGTVSVRYDSSRIVENFRTESDGKVLTLKYDEYSRYDCLWGMHTRRERVHKIPIR